MTENVDFQINFFVIKNQKMRSVFLLSAILIYILPSLALSVQGDVVPELQVDENYVDKFIERNKRLIETAKESCKHMFSSEETGDIQEIKKVVKSIQDGINNVFDTCDENDVKLQTIKPDVLSRAGTKIEKLLKCCQDDIPKNILSLLQDLNTSIKPHRSNINKRLLETKRTVDMTSANQGTKHMKLIFESISTQAKQTQKIFDILYCFEEICKHAKSMISLFKISNPRKYNTEYEKIHKNIIESKKNVATSFHELVKSSLNKINQIMHQMSKKGGLIDQVNDSYFETVYMINKGYALSEIYIDINKRMQDDDNKSPAKSMSDIWKDFPYFFEAVFLFLELTSPTSLALREKTCNGMEKTLDFTCSGFLRFFDHLLLHAKDTTSIVPCCEQYLDSNVTNNILCQPSRIEHVLNAMISHITDAYMSGKFSSDSQIYITIFERASEIRGACNIKETQNSNDSHGQGTDGLLIKKRRSE